MVTKEQAKKHTKFKSYELGQLIVWKVIIPFKETTSGWEVKLQATNNKEEFGWLSNNNNQTMYIA